MTEKIEVDPVFGATAFRKAENSPIKVACSLEVVHWECDVKGAEGMHVRMLAKRGVCSLPEDCPKMGQSTHKTNAISGLPNFRGIPVRYLQRL